jgi:hypothetical protein
MKKLFLFFTLITVAATSRSQSLSINTDGTSAHTSSILDIKSTTKGMLVPRMTTAQRMAIPTPANGLMVYDTDTNSFWYFKNVSWTNLSAAAGGGGQLTLPFDTTVSSLISPFTVRNTYAGSSVSIKGENLGGNGIYGYTSTGKGVLGYANNTGTGIEGYSANGIGIRAISGASNAIKATASGTGYTIEASAMQADAIYANTSAAAKAAIRGEATASGAMGVFGTSTATNGYGVRGFSGTGTGTYGQSSSGYGIVASSNSGVGLRTSSVSGNALEVFGKLKIYGSAVAPQNGAVLTSDAEGNATWKLNRVAFRARGAGGLADESSNYTLNNVEEYDYSNSFNTATGGFTAPVTGVYSFGSQMTFTLSNDINDNITFANMYITVYRGGVIVNSLTMYSPPATFENGYDYSNAVMSLYGDLKLQAGDLVRVGGYSDNSADANITWKGTFFGHLVFAD